MTIPQLIEELDRLALVFRVQKKVKHEDQVSGAQVQLRRIRQTVDEMPDAERVVFRKIVVDAPEEFRAEYQELKNAMLRKGLHVG